MSVLDVAVAMVIIITFAFVLLIATFITTTLNTEFTDQGVLSPTSAAIIQETENTMSVIDEGMVFFVFGLLTVTMIGAFLIDTYPVFFVASLIVTIVVIFASGILVNSFFEVAQTADFLAVSNTLPYTLLLLENLPAILFVYSIMISIVIYSKIR